MTFGKQLRPVLSTSPKAVLYSGRFTGINGAAPTSYKLPNGASLYRSSEGTWVITLPKPMSNFKHVHVTATDNDGVQHDVQYTLSASNRTITVTQATGRFASVTTTLTDVSTASTAYCASPAAGTVTSIRSVLGGAISGADSAITTAINGVAITNGNFTVAQSGSAAGDRDSATPTAANTVAVGDALSVTTDGASTGTATLNVTYVISPALEDVIDEISFSAVVEESDVPGAGV